MIKSWNEFIREFIENSDNVIDIKMQEIKDLIDGFSDGQNIIYEWKNKSDHQLEVAFSIGDLSIKYEFDIDQLEVTKIAGDSVDFKEGVESIDEGLDIIEKDIHSILGVSESHTRDYDSSLTEEEVREVTNRIRKFAKIEVIDNTADVEGPVEELQESLSNYDKETIDLVIDTTLFGDDSDSWEDWAVEQIITTGDKIMSKHGTEPMQLLNAYNDVFIYLKKYFRWEE